ncbi:MAG: hypothetical protein ACI8WB_003414 [Phenylobacterium sp.]|jgi:hypothetical protein
MKDEAKITNQKLAIYLRKLRHEKKHSMRTLSEILGTPHSFVGKTEKQGRRLDFGEFVEYCRAMEEDPEVVFNAILKM